MALPAGPWRGRNAPPRTSAAGRVFLDLESGTHRAGALKFYFTHGFAIDSFHFSRKLRDP
jgi:hypothetical protein